jgi:hypothetical protein
MMKKVSGMDYENTPFNIPDAMMTGKDRAETINNPFASVNRRNLDHVVRQININSKKAQKALASLTDEVSLFVIDPELETVTLGTDGLNRILALAEELRIAFENLLKDTE